MGGWRGGGGCNNKSRKPSVVLVNHAMLGPLQHFKKAENVMDFRDAMDKVGEIRPADAQKHSSPLKPPGARTYIHTAAPVAV